MREILFRGQTRRHGEKVGMNGEKVPSNWVYGGIFLGKGDFSVIYTYDPIEKRPVYTDTVGQYTGLTDKNGKKIFEGDILEIYCNNAPVIYSEENCVWYVRLANGEEPPLNEYDKNSIKIIGNIYDSPELLKGGDNNG